MKLDTCGQAGTSTQRNTLDWLVRVAAPLLGLTGAVLYGVLRLAYLTFYLQLRATPEEVGYGYVEILATQLIGAIELVLFGAILIFLAVLATHYLTSVVRRLSHPRRRGAGYSLNREKVWRVGRRSGAAAVLLVVVLLPCLAWLLGAEAKNGYAVRNVYPRGFIVLPILAVQAVPARVEWVSETGPTPIEHRECLLYLGSNNGMTVFYDVHNKDSVRLPSAAIVVTLPFTNRVTRGC